LPVSCAFAKLFSDAVEAVDPRPVEGIRVTGAVRVLEVIFRVFLQAMRCEQADGFSGNTIFPIWK
jgi:ABC-type phosphate/phosphonate transport system permease subunit